MCRRPVGQEEIPVADSVWCSGEVQNIAAVHPTRRRGGSAAEDTKAALLAEFGHFHPDIVRLLEYVVRMPSPDMQFC